MPTAVYRFHFWLWRAAECVEQCDCRARHYFLHFVAIHFKMEKETKEKKTPNDQRDSYLALEVSQKTFRLPRQSSLGWEQTINITQRKEMSLGSEGSALPRGEESRRWDDECA